MSRPSAPDRRFFWPVTLLMLGCSALGIIALNALSYGSSVSLSGLLPVIPLMLRYEPQLVVLILVCFLGIWLPYALITLGAVGPRSRTGEARGAPNRAEDAPRTRADGITRSSTGGAARPVVVHIDPITAMTAEERGQAAQVLGIPWRTELRDDDLAWETAYESALAQLRPRH